MKCLLIVFAYSIFAICSYGQQNTSGKDLNNTDFIETGFSSAIPNSAVLITVGSHAQKHGTGFLLTRQDDESLTKAGKRKACRSIKDDEKSEETSPCRILLVTNKHVLPHEGDDSPVFVKISSLDAEKTSVLPTEKTASRVKLTEIEIHIFDEIGAFLPSVKIHPRGYDIAAIDITSDIEQNKLLGFSRLSASILAENSNPPEGMRALPARLGDQVYILGFPSGIYDPRNLYPILRLGMISTNPRFDFVFSGQLQKEYGFPESIKGFLIDAAVFPGSSGSLVLRKPINYEYPYAPYAVGIVSDSIPIKDFELKSEQRMGLAVVYSAEAIRETLNLFK